MEGLTDSIVDVNLAMDVHQGVLTEQHGSGLALVVGDWIAVVDHTEAEPHKPSATCQLG